MVTNARHFDAISKAIDSLERVSTGLTTALPGDLLAMDIRDALSALAGITGEVTSDEVLGAIFGKFCIGK
jgi:tRNA modification GTPase